MDNSQENNPQYPINNSDPARIAHLLKFAGIDEIKAQIETVRQKAEELYQAVSKLSKLQLSIGIEHAE